MPTTVVVAIKIDGAWKEHSFECRDPQWRIAFKTMKDSGYPIRLFYR